MRFRTAAVPAALTLLTVLTACGGSSSPRTATAPATPSAAAFSTGTAAAPTGAAKASAAAGTSAAPARTSTAGTSPAPVTSAPAAATHAPSAAAKTSAAATSPLPTDATALMKLSSAAAIATGGVHTVTTSDTSPTYVCDDLATRGRQDITTKTGSVAHVIALPGTTYISGNTTALRTFFGISAQDVAIIGTKWVSLVPSDPGYKARTDAVTLASALGELQIPKNATVHPGPVVDGAPTTAIDGTVTGSGMTFQVLLYVKATGSPLPLEYVVRKAGTTVNSAEEHFTQWGERPSITAPSPTVAASSLPTQP